MIVGGRYRQILATSSGHFPTLMMLVVYANIPVSMFRSAKCLEIQRQRLAQSKGSAPGSSWAGHHYEGKPAECCTTFERVYYLWQWCSREFKPCSFPTVKWNSLIRWGHTLWHDGLWSYSFLIHANPASGCPRVPRSASSMEFQVEVDQCNITLHDITLYCIKLCYTAILRTRVILHTVSSKPTQNKIRTTWRKQCCFMERKHVPQF